MIIPHRAGDGLHNVNDTLLIYEDGSVETGDPSDACVLLHAHWVAKFFGLSPIWELWNSVYPDDIMYYEDAVYILDVARAYTVPVDPGTECPLVVDDLRAIGQNALGELLEQYITCIVRTHLEP